MLTDYSKQIILGWLIWCYGLAPLVNAEETITPSHLYQITEDIISEIKHLRETIGVDTIPLEPEPQSDKLPVHVYSKALEVLEKISRTQRKLGMLPAKVEEIPLKVITFEDIMQLLQTLLAELRHIKQQLLVKDEIKAAALVGGKTASQVYERLWQASYLLDGLIEPLQPSDVYRHLQYLHDELRLIAAKLEITLDLEPPDLSEVKKIKNIGQQALLALYKISSLERRLGMEAVNIPDMTLARITFSDIYDMTNILLAEMVRIKVHL
ncbi:MAG: hypothetical protein SVR94_20145, partial [Pseudomonadota bacterium]|nr:hypothetical protein [Pseudomonadota bacterium]